MTTTLSIAPSRDRAALPTTDLGASPRRARATIAITSIAAFMTALDALAVNTALPAIRVHLHAGVDALEWTVNAYTLMYAVLLLPAAALGERLGRRRVFVGGLALFTVASAVAALAPDTAVLVIARAAQGIGGAAILPLAMTLLTAAVPAQRRGTALGVLGALSGAGVALGPVVGGAVTQAVSWQFIFWLNVPVGLVLTPLAATRLRESRGHAPRLDLIGLALASTGLFLLVYATVRSNTLGWSAPAQLSALIVGAVLVTAFVIWQRRTAHPMLPLHLFRSRAFTAVNLASLLTGVGLFGAGFLLSLYLQNVLGYSPLGTGVRLLPLSAAPLVIAPLAGPLTERLGGRPLIATGLTMQSAALIWLGLSLRTDTAYPAMVVPFVLLGVGFALFFVPVATVVMGSVPAGAQGVASGANNALRELGGVVGIAVLAAVLAANGSYTSPRAFVLGLHPALLVGAGAVAVGAVAALLIPRRSSGTASAGADRPRR